MKFFISIKFLLVSLCINVSVYGQFAQTDRVELPLVTGQSYEISALSDSSLVLYQMGRTPENLILSFIQLDTALQKIWDGIIPINREFQFSKQYTHQQTTHFLLNSNRFEFKILSVDFKNYQYSLYDLQTLIPVNITEFKVSDYGALIGGYFNQVPIVLFFEFASGLVKVLPGLFGEQGELNQIEFYDDGSFDILLCSRYFTKQKTIWIKSYTKQGDLANQIPVFASDQRSLLFGRSVQINQTQKVVVGVFGNRYSEYSKGLFIANLKDEEVTKINFYNYTDLENFFKFLKAKKEARLKTRIERRKQKGKKSHRHYRLLVHELFSQDNQVILLAEAFYPKYKQADNFGGYFPGMPTTGRYRSNYDRIFDGYRYTHAAVLGIDKNGNLIWDNCFEINDVKTFELEQFVKAVPTKSKINLVYSFENTLRFKSIQGNKVIENKNTVPIKSFSQNTNIVSSENTKVTRWYGNILLAYGVQEISINLNAATARVFFINKLESQ